MFLRSHFSYKRSERLAPASVGDNEQDNRNALAQQFRHYFDGKSLEAVGDAFTQAGGGTSEEMQKKMSDKIRLVRLRVERWRRPTTSARIPAL